MDNTLPLLELAARNFSDLEEVNPETPVSNNNHSPAQFDMMNIGINQAEIRNVEDIEESFITDDI